MTESSGNQTRGEPKVIDVVVAALTIVTAIATIMTIREKAVIVATGIISAAVLGLIATLAGRRSDKVAGSTLAVMAVITLVLTLIYGLAVKTTKPEVDAQQPVAPTVQPSQKTLPTNSETPVLPVAPSKERPLFEGSADIVAGEAIDLETQNPRAQRATRLAAPNDVFIEQLFSVYDRDGYLIPYTGDTSKAHEECSELLTEGTRSAMAALATVHYCVLTSEGRVALIRFTPDEMYRVGGISYQVWDN
ncbi:MAG: hypothetical protein ACRDTG_20120 [Pseudonocardiaceae bacterium]